MYESQQYLTREVTLILLLLGRRDVQDLRVQCSSVDRGCEWEGTVGTLEKHMTTCEYELVPCPKECKDDSDEVKQVQRKYLDEHLETSCPKRDHKCEFCGEKGTYSDITKLHDNICKKKIVPCPSIDCPDKIQRQSIKRHLESCVYTEVPCKYQKLGCDIKMARNVISKHEESEDTHHFHMALDTISALEDKLGSDVLQSGESMTFRLTEFSKKRDKREAYLSPTIYVGIHGYYHLQVEVNTEYKGTEGISAHLKILEGRYDNTLSWPFIGSAKVTLLNQKENNDHIERKISFSDGYVGNRLPFPNYISSYSDLGMNSWSNKCYLQDDTLYFKVSVEVSYKQKSWLRTTK